MIPDDHEKDPLEGESPDSSFDGLLPQGEPAEASVPAPDPEPVEVARPNSRRPEDSASDSWGEEVKDEDEQEYVTDEEDVQGEEEGLVPADQGTSLLVDSTSRSAPTGGRRQLPTGSETGRKPFNWGRPAAAAGVVLAGAIGVVLGRLLLGSGGADPGVVQELAQRVDQLAAENQQLIERASSIEQRTEKVETAATTLDRATQDLAAADTTQQQQAATIQVRVQQTETANLDQENRLEKLEQLPAAPPSLEDLLATAELTDELLQEIQFRVENERLLEDELRMVAAWAERLYNQQAISEPHKALIVEIAVSAGVLPGTSSQSSRSGGDNTTQLLGDDGSYFVAWQEPADLELPEQLQLSTNEFHKQLWRTSAARLQQAMGLAAAQAVTQLGNLSLEYGDVERADRFAELAREHLEQVPADAPERNRADRFRSQVRWLSRDVQLKQLAGQVRNLGLLVEQFRTSPPGGPVALNQEVFAQVLDGLEARVRDLEAESGSEELRAEMRKMVVDLRKQLQPNLPASEVANVLIALQRLSLQVTQMEQQQRTGDVVDSLASTNDIVAFLDQLDVPGMRPDQEQSPAFPLWSRLAALEAGIRQSLAGKEQLRLAELTPIQLQLQSLLRLALQMDIATVRSGEGGEAGGTVKIVSPCCSRLVTIAGAGNSELAMSVRQLRNDLKALESSLIAEQRQALVGAERRVASLRGEVRNLAAVVREQTEQHDSQRQTIRSEMRDLEATVRRDLQRPRPLPPEQLELAVASVLEKLAAYGYSPSAPASPSAPETVTPPAARGPGLPAPRIEPELPPADSAIASEMYGAGRQAFFSNNFGGAVEAVRYFSQAVRYDPQEPIYRYYLALALHCSGREPEAMAQIKAARKLETTVARHRVAASLERVQGSPRQWLETARLAF